MYAITLGTPYNEFGYNDHPAIRADFLASKQLTAMLTRMHSSRMRTARSSRCLLGGIGGVCLSAYWDTPPSVWAWTPPLARPPTSPLSVGLKTPPGQTP